ncbi:MAG: CbtA family protein [Tabrizicola sp.]|nr:CbtA family protein [Tabrizicola sp.]
MHVNPIANGLLSGAAAAIVAAILHLMFLQPLLLRAEEYESGARVHSFETGASHDHADAVAADPDHHSGGEATSRAMPTRLDTPWDPLRDAQTVGFFLVTYVAYGLILAAAVDLARRRGYREAVGHSVLWGAAGFATFALIPSFGLAPELPGMAAGTLELRQIWWAVTAAVTGATLTGLAFGSARTVWGGAGLIALTVLMFLAPEPEAFTGPVPPELSAAFAGRALGLAAAAWSVLAFCIVRLPQKAPAAKQIDVL